MEQSPFFEQFIDDYYAECDEHLAAIRRVLLGLEDGAPAPGGAVDPAKLNELRRSLHTLKGLSGMVGLTSAEHTAHALEDLLRGAGTGPVRIDASLLETLFEGTRVFERCVDARRTGAPPPSLEPLLRDVARRLSERAQGGDTVPVAPGGAPAGGPGTPGAVTWRFEFAPAPEIAARGITVEVVRERLRSHGDLLDARPRVTPQGIVFDFRVAMPPGVEPDDAWRADRLTWSREEPAAAPLAPRPSPVAPDGLSSTGEHVAASGSSVLRVDLARVEEIMRAVGDLVVSRSRFGDVLRRAGVRDGDPLWEELQETSVAMERQLRALREGVMRIRLVRIGEVFERLRFAVRDVARECGKDVSLTLAGQDTEIDKAVVDRMLEPLMHLVRNAVSHGIEAPAARRAAGKDPAGRLSLRAAASGDRIILEIEDDGGGIDAEAAFARATSLGIAPDVDAGSQAALLDVLCAPGFSTRDGADLASGRGVGMAVVRSTVRRLGGDIAVATTPARGTRFTIELPLTLMIVDALLVAIGPQLMALPQPVLREILQIEPAAITTLENNEIMSYRGRVMPVIRLRALFGLQERSQNVIADQQSSSALGSQSSSALGSQSSSALGLQSSSALSLYVLVVGSEAHPVGLVVDRLLGLREIVVQPVTDPLVAVPGVGGATELGDGRISLILDASALVRLAHSRSPSAMGQPSRSGPGQQSRSAVGQRSSSAMTLQSSSALDLQSSSAMPL